MNATPKLVHLAREYVTLGWKVATLREQLASVIAKNKQEKIAETLIELTQAETALGKMRRNIGSAFARKEERSVANAILDVMAKPSSAGKLWTVSQVVQGVVPGCDQGTRDSIPTRIRTELARLADGGFVVRVSEGLYRLPNDKDEPA